MTSPVLDTDILVAGGGVTGLAATAAFAAYSACGGMDL